MTTSNFHRILAPGPLARLRKVQDKHHPSLPLVFFSQTPSTQDEAKTPRFSPGSVFVALNQSQGRGREGRSWTFQRGNLAASWRCEWPGGEAGALLPLFAATAIHLALKTWAVPSTLKWPNDVLIKGGKLAGVLVDASTLTLGNQQKTIATIGLGLNVFTPENPPETGLLPPVGLSDSLASPPHFLEVLAEVLDCFWQHFPHDGFHGPWLTHYHRALAFQGEAISFQPDTEQTLQGKLLGVDQLGRLRFLPNNGPEKQFFSGRIISSP